MSDRMPVGPALEQLRELIGILRELGNAGPRDNSFKQWRQVTLTLLQRIWAGDQARAVRFRRIPFSAPSSRADANTIRECYARGVVEATGYLEGLASELECAAGELGRSLVRPPEVAVQPAVPPPAQPPPPTAQEKAPPAQPPPPTAQEKAPPAKPESGKTVPRSRQRLKDMLGFSDEGATSSTPIRSSGPMSPDAAEATSPAPVAPPAVLKPSEPAAPPPSAPVTPSPAPPASSSPTPARATREERPAPPLRLVPPPEPSTADLDPEAEEYDLDFDLDDEAGAGSDPPPTTLREMLDRVPTRRAAMPTRAAREVLSMAAMVDQLGVPPQRRAIVRAALIDLGHQMDAPPVQWAAIRQALAFMMDYPPIARRVIPMLLPFLDEAA